MAEKVSRTLREWVAPEHTALVVIDPQEDFVGTNGYAAVHLAWDVSRMQPAMRRLNHFIQKAREAGVMLVWIRTNYAKEMLTPNVKALWRHIGVGRQIRRRKGQVPKFLMEGSDGAKWWSEMIEPLPGEYVITKWHYDAFEDTSLDLLLRSSGIKALLITGVQTNNCCETTLRHAFIKGYYVVLVSDCTDTVSQQEYEATILNVSKNYGVVASSGEVLKTWESMRSKQ